MEGKGIKMVKREGRCFRRPLGRDGARGTGGRLAEFGFGDVWAFPDSWMDRWWNFQ